MNILLPARASTGEPLSHVDGRLKVTGQARYAAVHAVPGCVHGVLVCSAVARGRIKRLDHRYGRLLNHDLAEYHVPVHAEVPEITVEFIDQPEPGSRPHGAKGLGEIGLVGFAAAVANAVYHATGRRVRKLPITPDKLFERTAGTSPKQHNAPAIWPGRCVY